jgi:hypothetical protein
MNNYRTYSVPETIKITIAVAIIAIIMVKMDNSAALYSTLFIVN